MLFLLQGGKVVPLDPGMSKVSTCLTDGGLDGDHAYWNAGALFWLFASRRIQEADCLIYYVDQVNHEAWVTVELSGPKPVPSLGVRMCFLWDDMSHMTWFNLLRTQSETAKAFMYLSANVRA